MDDRRRLTLLDLAIAASAAVVPVLLGVLLLVATSRQNDNAQPARNSERHISVRHVAALKTFEYAIVRRDRVRSSLPSADELLARVPQCRSEWDGAPRLLARVRMLFT